MGLRDPDIMRLVAIVHAGATWFMVGLIWFVQLVHYPLFARAQGAGDPHPGPDGAGRFSAFALEHQKRTTWVVMPVMLVELVAATTLAWHAWFEAPPSGTKALTGLGLALLALVWLSTFLVQVPAHGRLGRGWDARTHRRLVATNWARTLVWTGRGVVALGLVASA